MQGYEGAILEQGLCGYHQYAIGGAATLRFASCDLCALLGADKATLEGGIGGYREFVYPADRAAFDAFLAGLPHQSGRSTAQYRLMTKNGVAYFSDTVTVMREDDGTLVGHSVLSDISALQSKTEELRFLNDTVPCGFLKYTCEKQPRITYINDRMLEMLGFDAALDDEQLDMYQSNIFTMIPPEERRRFSHYLNRVQAYGAPLAGEMTVLRCDGSRRTLFGWVVKGVSALGEPEFQSVCIDVSERFRQKKSSEITRYLKALADVYDIILEYDLAGETVKCLHAPHSSSFARLVNLPIKMREATEEWIGSAVVDEDRTLVRDYFHQFFGKAQQDDYTQITYRTLSFGQSPCTYTGQFLQISRQLSLFCCRRVAQADQQDRLKSEIVSLKQMEQMVMRFYDGIAGFEVVGDYVKPLYSSDNVRSWFGYSEREWLAMMEQPILLTDFIAHSPISYQQLLTLFETGQGEYSYYDLALQSERVIRAICSQRSADASATRYVMLYNALEQVGAPQKQVFLRTFGYFDVFVGGKPIAFRSEKSKELLALLVDRRGGFVCSDEAIGYLWPDEPATPVTMARYRKVALRLKNLLTEYGIPDIVESVGGKRRIDTERVQCDLYDYLSGKKECEKAFKGSYLSNYSWAEVTLAELLGQNGAL